MMTETPATAFTLATTEAGLLLQRLRLYARRRLHWMNHIWAKAQGESFGLSAGLEAVLSGADNQQAEKAWQATEPEALAIAQALVLVEDALHNYQDGRFAHLCQVFELGAWETDFLLTCLGPHLDPALAQVYAILHDQRDLQYASTGLAAALFGYGKNRPLPSGGGLLRWQLAKPEAVAPGQPTAWLPDIYIYNWLLGEGGLDPALRGKATAIEPEAPWPHWPLEAWQRQVQGLWEKPQAVRICLLGYAGSGRKAAAAYWAQQWGMMAVQVSAALAEDPQMLLRINRMAYLEKAAPVWPESYTPQAWHLPQLFPIQFLCCRPGELPQPIPGLRDLVLPIPELTFTQRMAIWQERLPQARTWPPDLLYDLARRFPADTATVTALAQKAEDEPATLFQGLEALRKNPFGSLAQQLACPFTWEDLLLPQWLTDELRLFAFEARERESFWESADFARLFPQGKGLLALLAGPPGTGKTMAAQVLAADLGLPLYRIDLASVVSKYIGETAKHMAEILRNAACQPCLLFFDEADALFGKRTEVKDAHDRYANTETNFLLQAIESYSGVALLATNRKSGIDSGFMRRFRYVLDFPKPDAEQRVRLWKQMAAGIIGKDANELCDDSWRQLGQGLELTGAQIKLALLSAVFAARQQGVPLARTHLMGGISRELAKEGRALSRNWNLQMETLNGKKL